jgi:cellulose synthase/poly-beta-1,6-N-acetylglucosamine synthase-like glycosyltransferase
MISVIIISKDEPALGDTLAGVCYGRAEVEQDIEVIVVDASEGRLDHIRDRFQGQVKWLAFRQPPGVRITIPHQRNFGVGAARGDIIVFTDAGCVPENDWLSHLTSPLSNGESMTHGLTLGTLGGTKLHDRMAIKRVSASYLTECATINTAFRREVYDKIGGFDETFAYGSDLDFSWRAVDAGFRIATAPKALVRHDWGTFKRQSRRSYAYGKAKVRLYRKHPSRFGRALREDPMVIVYPLFLLGLPITFIFPLYPALLLIPAWRNREDGALAVVADHLIFGAGVLTELISR